MNYSELLSINTSFQASINLEFDLNQIDKIDSYIPTEQSAVVLEELLHPIYFKNNASSRATVLIGPYGRGKSHLLLVLCGLLSLDRFYPCNQTASVALQKLVNKLKSVNETAGSLAEALVNQQIRLLPVIVNSNTTDIDQALILSLKTALDKAGLSDLLPQTNFEAAAELIDKWHEDYPDAYKKLNELLKEQKVKVADFKLNLLQCNRNAYDLFCEIYTIITSGSKFNPFINADVLKLYEAVSAALNNVGDYNGIYIIFDEFSKFLEANIDSKNMRNFKVLQDLAEMATRSGSKQIHLTCITHKDILEYSSSDSFRTVEGRFRRLLFVASAEQGYEMVGKAIQKNSKFIDFCSKHKEEFKNLSNRLAAIDVFAGLAPVEYEEKIIYGCFPLAPLTAFSLLGISELVGQNERSMFTYLSQHQPFAAPSFVESEHGDSLELITIDNLFDYFEELLKNELFLPKVHSIWAKTSEALRKATSDDQRRILKAIAIINIISDDRLQAVPAHIKAALLMDDEVFERESSVLMKKHILAQRDSLEYVLLTANGIDIQKRVNIYIENRLQKLNVCEALNRIIKPGYVIPREYNDRFSMTRFFKCVFMDLAELKGYRNACQISTLNECDGLVIYAIDNDRAAITDKLQQFKSALNIVVCYTDEGFTNHALIKRLVAIDAMLSEDDVSDTHYYEELIAFREDAIKQLNTNINSLYAPESPRSHYLSSTSLDLGITSRAELSRAISEICSEYYNCTPIINNEMINKQCLTAPIIKARNAVIDWLLAHSESGEIPPMQGNGPEASIFKSVFMRTGLYHGGNTPDANLNNAIQKVKAFIASCEKNSQSFEAVCNELKQNPIGIRDGVLPLIVAYALCPYKRELVIYYSGKEVEMTPTIICNMVEKPSEYHVLLESGTIEKERYIMNIDDLFSNHSTYDDQSLNPVFSAVKKMQAWVRALPEFSKKCTVEYDDPSKKLIDAGILGMRSGLLKYEINPREYLFTTLPALFDTIGNYDLTFEKIRAAKEVLDRHITCVKDYLRKQIISLFSGNQLGSAASAIMGWYEKLQENTKTHIFSSDANNLLSYTRKINGYDDVQLINKLAWMFSSMLIEDWTDDTIGLFEEKISRTIEEIEQYEDQDKGEEGNEVTVSVGINGSSHEKHFSNTTISGLGQTVLSNLRAVFEEYNEAIPPDEQLAILVEMIKEFIS